MYFACMLDEHSINNSGRAEDCARGVQAAGQATKAAEAAAAAVKEEEEEAAAQAQAAPMEEDDDEVDPLDAFMANEILPAVHQNGAVALALQVWQCIFFSPQHLTARPSLILQSPTAQPSY
jgi:hypothetical protein